MQGLLRCFPKIQCRALHHLQWQCHHHPVAEELSVLAMQGRLQEAISTLHRVDSTRYPISPDIYLRLIRSCIKFKAFGEGHEIHRHIIRNGIETDTILQNNLIILYSKCGRTQLAHELFDEMADKNLFSWTAMIGAYSSSADPFQAFEFYGRMVLSGIRADQFVYPLVLKSCARMKVLRKGQRVHSDIIRNGFLWDSVVMNSLIDMYMKCGSVADAERIFDGMTERDIFTWTTMISGYVQASLGLNALDFFKKMLYSDVKPQSPTLVGILAFLADMGCIKLVKQMHALILGSGFGFNKFVGSALIDAYACCGGLRYGRLVFDRVRDRDIACWNAVIKGYAQVGLIDEAIQLFRRIHLDGVNPNTTTMDSIIFHCLESRTVRDTLDLIKQLENGLRAGSLSASALLSICERIDDVQELKELHEYLRRYSHISNGAVASSLIGMYAKFGDLAAAREIFECTEKKELGLWNSMISSYADNGHADEAAELFDRMQMASVKPDTTSWNAVIAGFVIIENFEAALEMLTEMKWTNHELNMRSFDIILPVVGSITCPMWAKQIHSMFLRHGCGVSRFINTALINMYCNSLMLSYAVKLFKTMARKDIVSWNAIISGLAKNALLSDARTIFGDMETESIKPNIITWTSLISGYVQNGLVDEALKLFRQLQNGLKPNSVTIASILQACAQSATLSHGKAIHGYIIRSGTGDGDLFVVNTLMDMFIKCGYMLYAERIFQRLHQRDVVSWNTMIQGYVVHGHAKDGLSLFELMLANGITPDSITLLGVLSACGQAGLIDEGWKQFNCMHKKYGIVPSGKHYTCMVDLLGHGGCFEDARNFILQMPLQPTASLWSALLVSCKVHGNVEMAEYAARQLLELQPENPWNYEILSDIYASAGWWNDVIHVRKMMVDQGVEEQPGCSWIEVGNHVWVFTKEDISYTNNDDTITTMLLDLRAGILAEGYLVESLETEEMVALA